MGQIFYIDQLRTPSFTIGLVKIGSGFIVGSVETGLGRWTLVVAVISDDALFGFLRLDLSPWRYWNRCFLVALCCLIVRRPNLKVATKRLLHQQVKIVLVPCSLMEVHHYSYFRWCGYFWGPWVSFGTDGFSVRVTKITFKDWCLKNSHPTFLFLTNLNLMNYDHIIKSM